MLPQVARSAVACNYQFQTIRNCLSVRAHQAAGESSGRSDVKLAGVNRRAVAGRPDANRDQRASSKLPSLV
jgi:hypothetical protein